MANPVLVLGEHLRGVLSDITGELLAAGRRLADSCGAPLHAVLLGKDAAALAPGMKLADQVWVAEQAEFDMAAPQVVAAALQALIEQTQASLILIGGTNVSMGVGTIVSARTGLPFVNFCRSLAFEGGLIKVTSQLFGGKILADVMLGDGRGVLSLSPGAFPAGAPPNRPAPALERVRLPVASTPVSFERFIEPDCGDVDITKQSTLVAVGRGIQSQDNLELAEELAAALGGAVCASRPVIDQGWLPLSRQVGKSGMTVRPRLYLALGISGAPEHWEGMQGSQCIVAVNTDPRAPIFDGAHYGAVADAVELLPLLTEKVKSRRS